MTAGGPGLITGGEGGGDGLDLDARNEDVDFAAVAEFSARSQNCRRAGGDAEAQRFDHRAAAAEGEDDAAQERVAGADGADGADAGSDAPEEHLVRGGAGTFTAAGA